MARMLGLAAAVAVLSMGAARAADLPEAPAVGEAAAVQPFAEVKPEDFSRFLDGFTVTAVRVGLGAAGAGAPPSGGRRVGCDFAAPCRALRVKPPLGPRQRGGAVRFASAS